MTTFAEVESLLDESTSSVAPAIICRVEQHGDVLHESVHGEIYPPQAGADKPRIPVTTDTLFDLASVTKLFTATPCLPLCRHARLTLDSPVAEVLPIFGGSRPIGRTEDPVTKLPQPASPVWTAAKAMVDAHTINVEHLLAHTSGLPAWRNLFSLYGDTPRPGYSLSPDQISVRQSRALEAISRFDFAYPPGKSYAYSDVGLVLLGAVVAKVHGTPLDVAVEELVIAPLGLEARYNPSPYKRERFAPTEYCTWRNRRLHGEVHDENAAGLGGIAGHAGLFATAANLCKLGTLYLNKGEQLLNADLVDSSLRCHVATLEPGLPLPNATHPCSAPQPTVRRGLGWMLQTPGGASCGPHWSKSTFGHTGYTGASLWCDPEHGLAVALLTNRVYWGRDPRPILQLRQHTHSLVHDIVVAAKKST